MKKTILFALALACGVAANATDVKLIVQKIDNGGQSRQRTGRVIGGVELLGTTRVSADWT
jgi:hypothetical protein